MSTTTRQGREALQELARRMMRAHRGRRRSSEPRAAECEEESAATSAWRTVLLALLDDAERHVLWFPDERARVQAVRAALCARFERRPLPALDLRDLTFTMGLIATARGSQLLDHGLLSQCLRMLSPSAFAEYERAKGFVRVSPRFRC